VAGIDGPLPAAPTASPALLSALARLRLEGAIFLRGEYTESWAIRSGGRTIADLVHPGAERVIMFHVVADGLCWVQVDGDEERHWAAAGQVIVVPYGHPHTMGGVADAVPVGSDTLVDEPPWTTMPVLRVGDGGARTDIVCGYLSSDDPLFEPALGALPPVFVVRPPPGVATGWVQSSIAYALESTADGVTTDSLVATRLPELLLTEMLRLHLATAPATDRGWAAGLHDPVLAPAMALIHTMPERHWTVADLAAEVAVSRSVLDDRFRQVLGRSPIRYLTEWRMHIAEELLATSDASVVTVAHRVGYDSEEAFSRAFKRATGLAPAHWRAQRPGAPPATAPGH
jgi:AraC-like DNA-binding protein